MLYKRLIINGQEMQLAVNQTGKGAPTASTPGSVGVLYMDTDTGDVYKCTGGEDGAWLWEGLGSGGSALPEYTDADKGKVLTITADGPAWAEAGAALPDAEEASF